MADEGGDNYTHSDNVPSGAYIFKPSLMNPHSLPYFTKPPTLTEYANGFLHELALDFDDYALNKRVGRVLMRAYANQPMIEFDVLLAPIPADADGLGGKEVTVNFQAYNLTHGGKFWTDSNALEMQARQ